LFFYSYYFGGFDTEFKKIDSDKFEVSKKILSSKGEEITEIKMGEIVHVEVYLRSKNNKPISDAVLVDLFPGGFEIVLDEVMRAQGYDGYTPDFIDVREDRIISYGEIGTKVSKIRYALKAVNVGDFSLPAPFVEDMYQIDDKATGLAKRLKVIK